MPEHSQENKFDVVIIGAGIIGSSIAYFLARESRGKIKIAVVEKGTAGQEASGGAAGMLAAQIETETAGAFLNVAVESRNLYGPLAQELKEFSGVDIQWVQKGILSLATTAGKEKSLGKIFSWQKESGLECERLSSQEVQKQFPFLEKSVFGSLYCPQDGQVASSRVVSAFELGAQKMGVRFFENSEIVDYKTKNFKVTSLSDNKGNRFSAGKFIAACGPWMGEFLKGLVPIEPVRGQILIFDIPENWKYRSSWQTPVYCGSTLGAGRWGCYFVPKPDGHLLVGATSEKCGFDKSENRNATEELCDYAKKIFPEIQSFPFKGAWVGLRPGTPDHEPIFGLVPGFENFFVAGGHYRNGILLAPITGKIFSELILHGESSFPIEPFSPLRFSKK